MTRLPLAVMLIVAGLVPTIMAPAPTLAQAQDKGSPVTLKLNTPTRTSAAGQLALSATLTTSAGKPLNDRAVDFYQKAELFGPRDAFIGTAETDGTGVAVLLYEPALRGRQTILARFAGATGYAAAETTVVIDVRDPAEAYEPEPLPLAGLRDRLPLIFGGIVFLVWAILFGVLISTARGIKLAGQRRRSASEAAMADRHSRVPAEVR
ncbi:MAG: hypothetical protein IT307_07510 [Chloroflexi bacterium]|nr:hypothetical protein [Chloroflexota bacterium]